NCFEMWRLLFGGMKLLGAESGDANHAHIAVAPGLSGDPFDQIVAVPLARPAALRLPDAARRADHVHITARHQEMRVASLQRAGPERRPCRLRRQPLSYLGTLKVLVVNCER